MKFELTISIEVPAQNHTEAQSRLETLMDHLEDELFLDETISAAWAEAIKEE